MPQNSSEARSNATAAWSAARILGSDATFAVGRFSPDCVDGYRARSGGPLRATRNEAQADEFKILEAKDRIARVVLALGDGSRPAVERLAREALDLLNQVKS